MDILTDDRKLLDAFRRGDKGALTQVYCAYANDVFALLRRGFVFNAKNKRYAFEGYKESWRLESAVQDVFLKAFLEPARLGYDGLRPYKNYLFTIARNLMMDRFRKERIRSTDVHEITEIDEQELILENQTEDPERIARDKELSAQVDSFLNELSPELKGLFDVRFSEGHSVEACAKQLNMSEYQVKRDEKRIKKQFFYFMQERGYFKGYTYGSGTVNKTITTMMIIGLWGCP